MRRSLLRPPLVDAVLAAMLMAAGLVEAVMIDTARPVAIHAAVTVAVMAGLAWRRRFPLLVLVLAVAGVVAVAGATAPFVIFAALVIASYTTGAYLDGTRALAAVILAVGPLSLGLILDGGNPSDLVAVAVLYGGAWAVGRLVRDRSQRADELAERAALLEQADAKRRAEAAAEERARIARELHDIVSHSISVVALQTQAVRRRLGPEHAREDEDLRAVEAAARQAMAELRRLFGVLRSAGERPPLEPQPGLDQLPRLLEQMRTAGMPVELHVKGDPIPLTPGVDLAAYRVIQEGLTNALNHAGGKNVKVALRYGVGELELRIDDGGTGGANSTGNGHGLIGMRERVMLYGGRFDARPRPGGGFGVRATLPVHAEGGT